MPTTIKEAIAKWEEKTGEKASDSLRVDLWGQIPPIEKMDASLNVLSRCERLALSTNMIDKITNLNALKNLKVLSLGRNNIKSLAGIEATSETLTDLYLSYNIIEKLKGINVLKKLRVFYLGYNLVKDWSEFGKLNEVPTLEEIVFIGNPLYDKYAADGEWVTQVSNRLKNLKKLDGWPIIRDVD